jgi:two-component system CheB/CheR fusion protein
VHTIFVVEDDINVREFLQKLLVEHGLKVESCESAEAFLKKSHDARDACLLVDLTLPGKSDGLQLLAELMAEEEFLPVVVINGGSNISVAIEAMKLGAADYIQKPVTCDELLACIERVIDHSCYRCRYSALCVKKTEVWRHLTMRQLQVMERVLRGDLSNNIAYDLGISQRTVENHRAEIMRKTGSRSVSDLARISLATRWRGIGKRPPCFRDLPAVQTRQVPVGG